MCVGGVTLPFLLGQAASTPFVDLKATKSLVLESEEEGVPWKLHVALTEVVAMLCVCADFPRGDTDLTGQKPCPKGPTQWSDPGSPLQCFVLVTLALFSPKLPIHRAPKMS